MLPFWFLSYRISASILTNTLLYIIWQSRKLVIFPIHCPLSLLHDKFFTCLSICLSSLFSFHFSNYSLCSSFPGLSLSFVYLLLWELVVFFLYISSIDGVMTLFNAEGFQFYMWGWSLSNSHFQMLFSFICPVIISRSTCPKLSLSSLSHPHDSISQNYLFVPRQYHFFLVCQPPDLMIHLNCSP